VSRIAAAITGLKSDKLLVPFFTAGYPDLKTTIALVKAAEQAGADMVELGMPFSDPLADGPEIQQSSKAALDNGANLRELLKAVRTLRSQVDLPLVLMGYYNPVLSYGEKKFLLQAASAGVDGFIIPDLPVDEATEFRLGVQSHDMSAIFLVAPTSSPERVELIDKQSTDFVYAVTVTGVTGSGRTFGADTDAYLRRLKRSLSKPFVAGFGVSSPESARRLARYADGVVIGSALVKIIRDAPNRRSCLRQIEKFLSSVRRAL
jgi:tryptophan synthase alpha chain